MITDKEIQILKEMHFHGDISESEFERRMEQARAEETEARKNFMKAIAGDNEAPKTMTEQEAIEIIKGIDEVRGNLPEDGNDVETALMMAKDALEEIHPYRALGTVEELREAMEKQRAKKPLGGVDIDGNEYAICRECSAILSDGEWFAKYCPDCGQAIDWEAADD